MAYSLEGALPALVRWDVEYGGTHAPPIPNTMPDVVAADPGRLAEHDYWQGVTAPNQKTIKYYQPILERDLGGFFAAVGLRTEAYPAWTNLAGGSAITDPVVGAWALSEIEDEAWHLSFLYPAMREWLHAGNPEEQEIRQRQLVDDNETLLAEVLAPAHRNAEEYAVGRLGVDPKVLYGDEHVNERSRFVYRNLGIDPFLWPDYLRSVPDLPALAGAYEAVV